MKIKKVLIWIGIAIVIIVGVFLFFNLRGNSKKSYVFAKIERGKIEATVSCTGTLQFYNTQNVVPQVSGIVNRLYVDFNQKIRRGQILAAIDDSSFKLDEETALANLEKAKAQLEQSQTDYSNTKAFFDQNFKSQNDLDTARLNLITAQNAVQTSQVALDSARLNIRYSSILSPLNGIIVQRNINLGDAVTANQTSNPAFIVASDISKMQTLASVDESDIGGIKVGQKVRFTVQAFPDKKFNGIVSQIRLQPQVVQNVVDYTVVVDVYNKENLLLPGMTATMDLITSSLTNVLTISNTVLKFRPTVDMLKEMARSYTNRNRSGYGGGQGSGGYAGGFSGGMGQGGGFGNPGQNGAPGSGTGRTNMAVLWTVNENGKIRPLRVKLGVSDGKVTEISSTNITEGMQVITGIQTGPVTAPTQSRSPFMQAGQTGGRGGMGR